MNKIKLNNKGMTLIELLIVLAIMGIVIKLVYSIFFLGNKSFTISKNKGFAQQDARLVAEIITKELRTAKEIETEESELSKDYYTLEFDKVNNRLIKRSKDKSSIIISEGSIENISFNRDTEDVNSIITVSITTKEKSESYTLDFDIRLENIPDFNQEIVDENKIYYTKYD